MALGVVARHGRAISLVLTLFGLLLHAPPSHSLEDGRIGVLYVGCLARSPPFRSMKADPLFSMGFVQATLRDWAGMPESEVHRMVRIYMPRTYSDLIGGYDVLVLANANRMAVGPHIDKLRRGVGEGGMGFLMSGGWESFGGTGASYPDWGQTTLGRLLPTEDVIGVWTEDGRLVIDDPDHELIRSIPWSLNDPVLGSPVRWHHNPVTVRLGGQQLAHVICLVGEEDPLMVTWELGNNARVFALTSEIHALAWYGAPWTYVVDFGSNLMIYLDSREVPQDIGLVHNARSKIAEVDTRRSLLFALLDFCESFGANTERVLSNIAKMDEEIDKATPEYLQLRFEDMLETYRSVEGMLSEIEEDAVKLKDRTLLWVYVVEWLAVTGTMLVCAFILWSTMVRRKFYKEVRISAFKESW